MFTLFARAVALAGAAAPASVTAGAINFTGAARRPGRRHGSRRRSGGSYRHPSAPGRTGLPSAARAARPLNQAEVTVGQRGSLQEMAFVDSLH